eukprot:UC1_evm1s746
MELKKEYVEEGETDAASATSGPSSSLSSTSPRRPLLTIPPLREDFSIAAGTPLPSTMAAVLALPESECARAVQREIGEVDGFGNKVIVRTINHSNETCETKPKLRATYPGHVTQFAYQRKVILAFTEVQNAPVVFFGCVVHEYGVDCDDPNHLKVYISLLDSVKLPKTFFPSQARTALYHAVLRGYLRLCGQRGFDDAHIYTCPPRKGQNYIFPFKPDEQKEISVTRLRQWYADMLSDAMFRADPAVAGFMNIQEAYDTPALTEIPYFDGDNWPDILEDIIKLDEKAEEEERKRRELRAQIDVEQKHAWSRGPALRGRCRKPKGAEGGGYYEGQPSPAERPAKKRRVREPKKKLTLEGRLGLVLQSSHRDFLVVKLMGAAAAMSGGGMGSVAGATCFVRDPDAHRVFASTGEEHSLVSFFQAEKLEFSSVRHMRYTTMCLLHLLHSRDKRLPQRIVEPKPVRENTRIKPSTLGAGTDVDAAGASCSASRSGSSSSGGGSRGSSTSASGITSNCTNGGDGADGVNNVVMVTAPVGAAENMVTAADLDSAL